jgi:glycerol-3-phosphate dehydrogenase
VLVVVPSHAFTETLRALAPLRRPGAGVAWATKGFEPGSAAASCMKWPATCWAMTCRWPW